MKPSKTIQYKWLQTTYGKNTINKTPVNIKKSLDDIEDILEQIIKSIKKKDDKKDNKDNKDNKDKKD